MFRTEGELEQLRLELREKEAKLAQFTSKHAAEVQDQKKLETDLLKMTAKYQENIRTFEKQLMYTEIQVLKSGGCCL